MEIRARLSPQEGRRFALTVGGVFLLLAALMAWRGSTIATWVCAVPGTALSLAGLLAPGRLSGVYRAWMGIALAISRVTSPIVMGVMYFLVLTPIALVLRLAGRNPLRHRPRDGGYWMPASPAGARELENQF